MSTPIYIEVLQMDLQPKKWLSTRRLSVRLLCGALILCGQVIEAPLADAQTVAQNRRARPVRRAQPVAPQPPPPAAILPPSPTDTYTEPSYSNQDLLPAPRDTKRAPDTLWITAAHRFSVQGDFAYGTSKRDVRNTANVKEGEFTLTSMRFDVNGEYGINRNIAGRVATSYASVADDWGSTIVSPISSSKKTTGLGDVFVGARALYQRDLFLMAGEFNVGFSPADARVAGPSLEGNQFSGGFSIHPKIGGAYSVGRTGWIGGLLGYNFRLERNVIQATGGSSKVTGGSELSPQIFYEYQFNNMYLNPSFQYISVSDSTTTVASTSNSGGGGSRYVYAFEGGIYPIPALRLSGAYTLTSVPDTVVQNRTELSNYLHQFIVSARMQF
jgi:hypothetical protein